MPVLLPLGTYVSNITKVWNPELVTAQRYSSTMPERGNPVSTMGECVKLVIVATTMKRSGAGKIKRNVIFKHF